MYWTNGINYASTLWSISLVGHGSGPFNKHHNTLAMPISSLFRVASFRGPSLYCRVLKGFRLLTPNTQLFWVKFLITPTKDSE